MDANSVAQAALNLPERERARLVEALLASLDGASVPDFLGAWGEEAVRRSREFASDPTMGVPGEEVFREMRDLLA